MPDFKTLLTLNGCTVFETYSLVGAVDKINDFYNPVKTQFELVTTLSLRELWPQQANPQDTNPFPERFIGISEAYAGLADTGSLVLLSSEQQSTAINFLSEIHVVLLNKNRILENKDALWQKMRDEKVNLPRAINIITGPSRTADIEQTIQIGAHGPCELIVILIEQ